MRGDRDVYLQSGDLIVVQLHHLRVSQRFSCVVLDLKPAVELQNIQQLSKEVSVLGLCERAEGA